MKRKQTVFIGGVNGSGKTRLTELLKQKERYMIGKQKRALIAVGTKKNIPWEEIPSHYEELIEEAAGELADNFSRNNTQVMLIDCHYAFKMQKSLAANIEKKIIKVDEPYIQAVDDRLISRINKDFHTRFIFLEVKPQTAFSRTKDRLKNIIDEAATMESIAESQEAEKTFFKQILQKFNVPKGDWLILPNDGAPEDAIKILDDFINQG